MISADYSKSGEATRPAVHLDRVSFSFSETSVLDNASLDVFPGEFVAIVGRSGSGKSTLLRIISGLLPARGRVKVNGRTRMVFQEDRLFPWYTVEQNIAIALAREKRFNAATGPKKARLGPRLSKSERVRQLLTAMGMQHLNLRFPNELSGGERQRVAIARAFATEPDVVLMDEPFGALDVLTRETMQSWLLEFWQRQRTAAVLVTHDIEEGLLLADKIFVLGGGRLSPALAVEFPRPRKQELRYTPAFLGARREIHTKLSTNDDALGQMP